MARKKAPTTETSRKKNNAEDVVMSEVAQKIAPTKEQGRARGKNLKHVTFKDQQSEIRSVR